MDPKINNTLLQQCSIYLLETGEGADLKMEANPMSVNKFFSVKVAPSEEVDMPGPSPQKVHSFCEQ